MLEAHGKGGCGALHAQAPKNENKNKGGNGDEKAYFVSGGADGEVILWACGGHNEGNTESGVLRNWRHLISNRPYLRDRENIVFRVYVGTQHRVRRMAVGSGRNQRK